MTTKTKNTTPDADEIVFVIQPENRMVSLSWYVPRTNLPPPVRRVIAMPDGTVATTEVQVDECQTLECKSAMMLPGVNVIASADLERAGGADALKAMGLRAEDPTTIGAYYAADLARRTASRFAARKWLERETRDEIRAAIEERLNARDRRLQHERQAEQAADRARDDAHDPTRDDLSGGFGGESRV